MRNVSRRGFIGGLGAAAVAPRLFAKKPSDYDRDHALPFYSYIILRVAEGRPELMTSWRLRISREAFDPEPFEIEP